MGYKWGINGKHFGCADYQDLQQNQLWLNLMVHAMVHAMVRENGCNIHFFIKIGYNISAKKRT